MPHRLQIRLLPPSREGRPLTFLDRVKLIAAGVLTALTIAVLLVLALVLGSVIAAIIGLLAIAGIVILIVRGTFRRAGRHL